MPLPPEFAHWQGPRIPHGRSRYKFYAQLSDQEFKLLRILDAIGDDIPKFCVEFGAGDGYVMSNTLILRQNGWDALLIDKRHSDPEINLHSHTLTRGNINDVFAQYGVPRCFGYLSIDVDGVDWYLWQALEYVPCVVEIEYNNSIPPDVSVTVPYDDGFCYEDGIRPGGRKTTRYGASALALQRLGARKGYKLVEMGINNMFFVHESVGYNKRIDIADRFTNPKGIMEDEWSDFEWVTVEEGC